MSTWHFHPAVKSGNELTLGQRAADVTRSSMGSWPFVFAFVAIMGLWAGVNGRHGFDPYPFILLNLLLSTMAGLQGAILLISAKRADQISAELAKHTLDNTTNIHELLVALTKLTLEIHTLTKGKTGGSVS